MTTKKRKIKSAKTDAVEKGRTYGIESLNLSETSHAENDSVRGEENANGHDSEQILALSRICHMEKKINKYKIIAHECNILTDLLNPTKRANKFSLLTNTKGM